MSPSIKPTISATSRQAIHLQAGHRHMATGHLRPWDVSMAGDGPTAVGIGWLNDVQSIDDIDVNLWFLPILDVNQLWFLHVSTDMMLIYRQASCI